MADVPRTYHGTVVGRPGATAIGLVRADGKLQAQVSFEDGSTWVKYANNNIAEETGRETFTPLWPTKTTTAVGAGPTVYAAEVGIDCDYANYVERGSVAAVLDQTEFGLMAANLLYIRDAAIVHRLGKLIVRADAAQNPIGNTTDQLGDMAKVWNAGTPMGATHDVAAWVSPRSSNGGLAWTGGIYSNPGIRYSRNFVEGADVDFSRYFRHEVGHNWGSEHNPGGAPEGSTVMTPINLYSRFSSNELGRILAGRGLITGKLDNLGAFPLPVPPRTNLDTVEFLRNVATPIDVMANDSDSNGDSLALLSFDGVSERGGSITRSVGTGPGGRDQLLYSPPADIRTGVDWFRYRIQDSSASALQGVGLVVLRLQTFTPTDHWPLDERFGSTALNLIRDNRNGTHENGPLINQPGANPAVTRKGVYYDGVDDQTAIPAPGYNTNTLTFTAWVKRSGTQTTSAPVFFSRAGTSIAGLGFGSNNELRYEWNGLATTYNWSSGLIVPADTWCLVAMCVSPSGTTLHLRTPSGLQSATNSVANTAEAFDGTTYLGRDSVASTRRFKGWLDDARVYKMTLAADDIESLYAQAVTPPAVTLAAPLAGASISPLNVTLAVSISSQAQMVNDVTYLKNEAALGELEVETPLATVLVATGFTLTDDSPAPVVPEGALFATVLPELVSGTHSLTVRSAYGDWGYSVDSAPVVFTALPPPPPAVTLADTASAYKRGPLAGSFTLLRSHARTETTVSLTSGGTATPGSDYLTLPTSVTFPVGSLEQKVTVTALAGGPDNGTPETVSLSISPSAQYSLGDTPSASLAIVPLEVQVWDSFASADNVWSPLPGAANWQPASVWTQNRSARFDATSGSPEVVTLGADVVVNDLTFDVTGFSINGAGTGSLLLSDDLASTVSVNPAGAYASIAAILADNSGGASTLTKTGAGTLTLNGTGANTYSGGTVINAGTLLASHAGSLGTGPVTNTALLQLTQPGVTYTGLANRLLGNGTTQVTALGTGATTMYLSGDYSAYTGSWDLGVGATAGAGRVRMDGPDNAATTINVLPHATLAVGFGTHQAKVILKGGDTGESSGQLCLECTGEVWSGPVVLDGAATGANDGMIGARNGRSTLSGVISETGGSRELTKAGAGTVVLTGTNTYSGATRVLAGIVSVGNITNAGVTGNLGTHGTIALGNGATAGGLDYTGAGSTTDRVIQLAGTTGGASLTQSGASGHLKFTSAVTAPGLGSKVLELQGATAATAEIAGAIVNSTGFTTGVTKSGSGTWTLSGANTYTGTTTVGGGKLQLHYSTSNTSKMGDTGALVLAGGTVELSGGSHTEIVSATTLAAGTSSLITRSNGSSVLRLNGVTVQSGGSLVLDQPGIATTDNLNQANGMLGPWVRVNTGGALTWAKNATNAADGSIVAFTGYSDVPQLGGSIANASTSQVRIVNGGASGNLTLGGGALTQIASLQNDSTGATLAPAQTTSVLNIGAGGSTEGVIWQTATAGPLIIGTVAGDGVLTSGGSIDASPATLRLINDSPTNALTINSVIADNGTDVVSVIKAGDGVVTLKGANTYTGTTTLIDGTLTLAGGNNRLRSAGTVIFDGQGVLDVGTTTQALGNLTVVNGGTGTVIGSSGTLSLNLGTFRLGSTTAVANQALDLSGLANFQYQNASGSFLVGTSYNNASASNATLLLATTTTVTANTLDIGNSSAVLTNAPNVSSVALGRTTTLNANTLTIGANSRATGTLQFQAVANPSLTVRGATGGVSRANVFVGTQSSAAVPNVGTVDLTANLTGQSTLDARLDTLLVGANLRGSSATTNASIATGTFVLGGGVLDATTIVIGRDTAGGSSDNSASVTTGTFGYGPGAGTVKVGTLTLGDKNSTSANLDLIATFNLDHGGTLRAATIQPGNTAITAVTRNFNWIDGTIKTYDATTDLTIAAGPTFTLSPTGSHTFDVDAGRTITVNAVLAGPGAALTKTGAGTLILAGANTFTGPITILEGQVKVTNPAAFQNSVLDTTSKSGGLDLTGYTVPTFGGLSGNGNLATTLIGYAAMTELILNPPAGARVTYAGTIADGGVSLAVTKLGAGTQVLSGANTYTGVTTIGAGTLALEGGANRLPVTGTVKFTGNGNLDLGTTSQTLANLAVPNNLTGRITGADGGLNLGSTPFALGGTADGGVAALDLSGLGNFNYNGPTQAFVVSGGYQDGWANGTIPSSTGVLTLGGSSTVTAASFNVGNGTSSYAGFSSGTVNLGQQTILNTAAINIGTMGGKTQGLLRYTTGLDRNPTWTVRGLTGGSSRADLLVAVCGSGNLAYESFVDLASGYPGGTTLDARIGTLRVAYANRTGSAGSSGATGTFTMGGGTLDASTLIIAADTTFNSVTGGYATGNFNLGTEDGAPGGTLKVGTLKLGERLGASLITAEFNLNQGGTVAAQFIQPGASPIPDLTTTRTFRWRDGTLRNYDALTDLTIAEGFTTFELAGGGSHVFQIDAGRLGTVNQVLSGSGGLTKLGAGTLALNATHTYTGRTTIGEGSLLLAGSLTSDLVNSATFTPQGLANLRGTFTQSSTGRFQARLNTLVVGSGYDQLKTSSGPVLAGALELLPAAVLAEGSAFTLIDNLGTEPVSGTFSGLSQAAEFYAGGHGWRISYTGGTGNDVVVTRIAANALQTWQGTYFGAAASNPEIAGDTVDYDRDGVSNLLEYALGLDPATATAPASLPQSKIEAGKLTLTFTRSTAATDVTVTVQGTDTLNGTWTDLARSTAGAPTVALVDGVSVSDTGTGAIRTVLVTDAYSTNTPAPSKRFLRLRVTR